MSRHQWAEHEFSKHRQIPKWTCNICNLDMTTELSSKVHISEDHADLDETKFEALQKSASDHSATWINQQSCPFCRSCPASSKRQFISHVGRHLQEVSQAAIPPSAMQGDSAQFGEDTEDEALSAFARHGTQDAEQTSVTDLVEVSEQPQATFFDPQTYTAGELRIK